MRRAKRNWGFERLEYRSLLTGTVNAVLKQIPNDPQLFIAGDNSNNHIVIHETRNLDGTINVKVDGIGTTIKAFYQSLARPVIHKLPNYSGTSFVFRVKDILINMGGETMLWRFTRQIFRAVWISTWGRKRPRFG